MKRINQQTPKRRRRRHFPLKQRTENTMLNACCGGIRPGHEDTKEGGVSGLHDMSTIELPVGHVKIDPEGSLFPFFACDSNISLARAMIDDLVLSLCRLNANKPRNSLLTYKYYFSSSSSFFQTRGRWKRTTHPNTCTKCATRKLDICKRSRSRRTTRCRRRSRGRRSIS